MRFSLSFRAGSPNATNTNVIGVTRASHLRLAQFIQRCMLSSVGSSCGSPSSSSGSQKISPFQDKPLTRTNIGIFGSMNVGKSSLMNLLTSQQTSIVDSKAGTTADTKIAFMEMHNIGPVKLFDTPGIDEEGDLGRKKKEKAVISLKEADVAIIIVDPLRNETILSAQEIVDYARKRQEPPHVLLVYNLFGYSQFETDQFNHLCENIEKQLGLDDPKIKFNSISLHLNDQQNHKRLIRFIEEHCTQRENKAPLLPQQITLDRNSIVFFNIPMDGETPSGRLLRPQALMQEALLRNYVSTVCYRMDLGKARSADPAIRNEEEARFKQYILALKSTNQLKLLVTDSQAIDIIHPWTLDESGNEIVSVTTFSIAMINYMSGGKLTDFVEGLKKFQSLQKGDKVLICEACNHNRILDDIGTVQIPRKINQKFGDGSIHIDHAFGREYQTKDLSQYKMVIHCGGCMIDQQKMVARLGDIEETGVPITNYGVLLSMFQSKKALGRVLEPYLGQKVNLEEI